MTNDLFRLIRIQKRITQRDFAKKVGISKALVSLIESKERSVTKATSRKVMSAFGLTPEDLENLAKLDEELKGA